MSLDVVIVGAGSAGCVVARRLVDAGVDVLLLEAGGVDDNPAIHDPLRSFEVLGGPEDWGYMSVSQDGLGGRRIALPRGKVLGGSSCLNGMIWVRGHRSDFDTWAYVGNAGWGYDDVLPLFKRLENFDGGASEYRGAGGPLHVLSRYEPHPCSRRPSRAAEQGGVPPNPDCNAETLDGVGADPVHDQGRRAPQHLAGVPRAGRGAANLTVLTGCHVRRLLFDGPRCVGLELVHDGKVEQIRAEHEVLVCAGVFDSPKLLMLSGIGPADELARHGIDVVVDLPGVGENLQDHVFAPARVRASKAIPPAVPGVMQFHGQMFWRSRSGLPGPTSRRCSCHLPLYPDGRTGPRRGYPTSMLSRPASRGTVRLASADPGRRP